MIYEKLFNVQQNLVAPKDQFNEFGKYKYRSCESILEALKPLLKENKMTVLLSDTIVEIGGRVYVEATATAFDFETGEGVSVTAAAREEESKKGMDASQVTGASSSYARKYALNGLFCIDDNQDSDSTNRGEKQPFSSGKGADVKSPAEVKKSQQTAEKQPVEAPAGYFYCENCGTPLTGTVLNNGKRIDHKEVAKRVLKKYGKQLCFDCCKNAVPTD